MAIAPYASFAQTPVDRARTFAVVVDDTPECRHAMRFAAGRAAHTLGGRLKLIHVLPQPEFSSWGALEQAMEQEAREAALTLLADLADELRAYSGVEAEIAIATGVVTEELLGHLRSDPSIFALVLAASPKGDPGPLVEFFSGQVAGSLPCPVILVPGGIAIDQIDALV
jgi:nucleotide-binding universal stress UspA family protein